MAVFDVLEQARPQGETQLVPVLHELAETIRQRALIVILSDLFVEPEELRGCFQHLRFRKHDVAVFHLLDPQELGFDFRRPMRFLDMEGGPAIFAEPNEIAERYHKALGGYLDGAAAGRAGVGRRLSPGRRSTRITSRCSCGSSSGGRASKGRAMSFLQPMLLAALPLVALPIIIHLINQRRYQTVRWAAMMFLLAANRMSRGYARLRQWLIMAFRMLAIAGLIFAVSRPLAGGWLGLAARRPGRHDDRPARPLAQHAAAGPRAAARSSRPGRRQLVADARDARLGALGPDRERRRTSPRELESADALLRRRRAPGRPAPRPTSRRCCQAARDYIRANKAGRTEIWICSDLRENDWNADSGRWQALRDAFLEFPQGVRFHLLAYPAAGAGQPGGAGDRASAGRRPATAPSCSSRCKLAREGGGDGEATVPVQFEIDGARSEVTVEMAGPQAELKDHRIPLGRRASERGWGRVSIPADANPADNDFWFVFDQPAPRRAIVVAEDAAGRPAAAAGRGDLARSRRSQCSAEVVAPSSWPAVEWDKVAAAALAGPAARGGRGRADPGVRRAGRSGRSSSRPRRPDGAEFLGVRWTTWSSEPKGEVAGRELAGRSGPAGPHPERRGAAGRAARRSGGPAGWRGELTPLATLKGGAPLLARVATNRGGAYFCATTPAAGDSSLATDGVVLYVLVQRALAAGAAVLGTTRQLVAGEPAGDDPTRWKRLAGGRRGDLDRIRAPPRRLPRATGCWP